MAEKVVPLVPASSLRVTYLDDVPEEIRKDWLIRDFLAVGEFTVLYGVPGCGKSLLVGDVALHVAAAHLEPAVTWFGRRVRGGGVLYLAAERSALVKRRMRAWAKEAGFTGLPIAVVDGSCDLVGSSAHAEEVIRIGRRLVTDFGVEVALVVVDTKARVFGGGDPNDDVATMALVANITRIQTELGGPHVAVVDHVPHSAPDRIKGSGALGGASDGSFLVRKENGAHAVTIGSKAPNDGPYDLALSFTLRSVVIHVDKAGNETTAPVVVPSDDEGAGTTARAPKLGRSGQVVMKAFGRLLDDNQTVRAPNAPGVLPGTRAVTIRDLRDKALALGLHPEPEPTDKAERDKWLGARRQAWKRGASEVQRSGTLRIEEDFVWDPRSRPGVADPFKPED